LRHRSKGWAVDGVYPYGENCHGQDTRKDDQTTLTTNVEMEAGTYYFQVIVFGQNNYYGNPPCTLEPGDTECGAPHWSNVLEVKFTPRR